MALAMAPAVVPSRAQSQTTLPDKAIRMLVGFSTGGGTDALARVIAQRLERRLGRHVIVEIVRISHRRWRAFWNRPPVLLHVILLPDGRSFRSLSHLAAVQNAARSAATGDKSPLRLTHGGVTSMRWR